MSPQQIDQRTPANNGWPKTRASAQFYGRPRRAVSAPSSRRPSRSSAVSPFVQAAFAATVIPVLGGCITGFAMASVVTRSADPTSANDIQAGVGGVSAYGLPFAAGTSIEIAQGPHADNFNSVPGYQFSHAGDVPSAIDLAAAQGTAVRPVSAGRVLSAWPVCNVVVVDQGAAFGSSTSISRSR
jgi:hypothetical protein